MARSSHGLQLSATASGGPPSTPEQRRFDLLVGQLGEARRRLADWHDAVELCRHEHARVIRPQVEALLAVRRDWLFALDGLIYRPGRTKAECAVLCELVVDGAASLLADAETEDVALKALHDRHAEVDFDTAQRRLRGAAGHPDCAERSSDAEGAARGASRRTAAHAGSHPADADAYADAPQPPPPRRRKPAVKPQQRRDAEAQLAARSMREVFRRLAGALHPDREADPARRDAKTTLMQRANRAHAANDLLALLELQLEIEQIDAGELAAAGARRLGHYNQLLSGQLAELGQELVRLEAQFRDDFGLRAGRGIDPSRLPGLVSAGARELREAVTALRRELHRLDDPVAVKQWLRQEQRRRRGAVSGDG